MMVRKQVYITREQNEALKQKAQELGVTEAELIRRGIEALSETSERGSDGREIQYRARRSLASARAREVATMEYRANQAYLDSSTQNTRRQTLEEDAWQAELAFMRSLGAGQRDEQRQGSWRFEREEVYEERLAQILRRH